ncbi:MAG: 4-(cytidine 5'-diphospho)-2-C-methyl-D-erythritol kinase [Acidimicrobiales bacterium]
MHEERAPAKLTLSLRVTGRRDDGYHLIDAEMVTLDLADTITFSAGRSFTVTHRRAPVHPFPMDGTNLVQKALTAVGRHAAIHLEKVIPMGAGLGGGSADAAAVLRWAGCGDVSLAASLGADVPFCLVGGRARVTGIGEVVERLELEARAFTLLVPSLSVSTVEVYRMWDEMGGPVGGHGNDLEPAALAVVPELAKWRERLGEATGLAPRLAGSGGSWFVEGDFPGDDRIVARTTAAG